MEKTSWKIIAIVFITLFVLETALIGWGIVEVVEEEKQTNECYYEFCKSYPEALLENGVCFCYDYNEDYELIETDSKVFS